MPFLDLFRTDACVRERCFINTTVLITGAGSGMGQEMAVMVAAAGAGKVILCDLTAERLNETKARCETAAAGRNVGVVTAGVDVTDYAAMERWGDELKAETTRQIQYLISNVGVVGGRGLLDTPKPDWDRIFSVNFDGTVNTLRVFLPFITTNPPHTPCGVITMSSVNGFYSCIGTSSLPHSAYVAAKFAVRGVTESLMVELSQCHPNITVTCVHPGVVGTNLLLNSCGEMRMKPAEERLAAVFKLGIGAGSSSEEIRTYLGENFKKIAPIDGREAADVIISAVSRRHTRVLVGGDAYFFDYSVRLFPRLTYHPCYFPIIATFYALRQVYLFVSRRPYIWLPATCYGAWKCNGNEKVNFVAQAVKWYVAARGWWTMASDVVSA